MLVHELIPQYIDYEEAREFSLNRRRFEDCVLHSVDFHCLKLRGVKIAVKLVVSTSRKQKLKFQGSGILNKNWVVLFCGNAQQVVSRRKNMPSLESSLLFIRAWKLLVSVQCFQKPWRRPLCLFRNLFLFWWNSVRSFHSYVLLVTGSPYGLPAKCDTVR